MPKANQFINLLVCVLVGAAALFGQVNGGSLAGQVTDPARGSAQGAATGFSRTSTSDSSGYYNFPILPIGTYAVTVDQPGFDKATATVVLGPAQKGRQDFELSIGTTNTSVQVTAAAPGIQHDDASLGTTIENQVIEGTPLFLRNWDDLIRLVPGVQQNRYTEQGGATASGRTGDFSVHGVHSL